jgi:hypothetical protein
MILKDDHIGEPGYPAPWTTTLPREGLRDTDEARIVCLEPDVCKSPNVPISYMIVDFCGHDQGYTPSVRFTSQKAMVLRSQTTDVHGDEPGVGKGERSGTVGGICEPIGHASLQTHFSASLPGRLPAHKGRPGRCVGADSAVHASFSASRRRAA